MPTPIVFFGNERIATGVKTDAPTLTALINAGYDVKAVVANFERGVSRNSRKLEVQEVAQAHNIPLLLPDKPSLIIEELKEFNATAAVLVAYGKIVPQRVIDVFPRGIINIHPSLLPLHRGPIPLESVILNGEHKTGVSVMQLVKAMDAGPVYGQRELVLSGAETKQELADKLLYMGSEMVIKLLPDILNGKLAGQIQDERKATYDKLLNKEDGIIDWSKPAIQIEREIRAFAGWPKSSTTLAGIEVIVTAAHFVTTQEKGAKYGDLDINKPAGELGVVTGSGTLWIDRLKPVGKQEMTAKAFLAGYGKSL